MATGCNFWFLDFKLQFGVQIVYCRVELVCHILTSCEDNSSVKKHLSKCQNNVHKGIEIKCIVLENDPANLRLFKAFYIRKYKPTINSREECSEFADLLFSNYLAYLEPSFFWFCFDTRSLDHITRFYSYLYLIIHLRHFTPTFLRFLHIFIDICI